MEVEAFIRSFLEETKLKPEDIKIVQRDVFESMGVKHESWIELRGPLDKVEEPVPTVACWNNKPLRDMSRDELLEATLGIAEEYEGLRRIAFPLKK